MTEKCNKCWSINGEEFFDDWDRLIEELQDYECDEIPVGTEYYEGDKVDVEVKDYVNLRSITSILEDFDDQLYQDIGEVADCDFYNVTPEAKKELQEFIQSWAEKHVKLPYWKVQNVVTKVVTKEDLC